MLLFAGRNGYLDNLDFGQIDEFKEILNDCFNDEAFVEFRLCLENLFSLDDEIIRDLTLHQITVDLTGIVQE